MNTQFLIANELAALLAAPIALILGCFATLKWKTRILVFGQIAAFCFAFFGLIWGLINPSIVPGSATLKYISLNLDIASCCLLTAITFIAAVVLSFSDRYLLGDANRLSFLRLLAFMSSCAALLSVSDSICLAFVCWNALSLGLWAIMRLHSESKEFSNVVLVYHLLSDLGFLAALILIISGTESTQFSNLSSASFSLTQTINHSTSLVACLLLVLSFGIKSALFPFHRWLLATLNAPTPLSGFLHAGVVNVSAIMAWRLMPILHEQTEILLFWGLWSAASAIVGTLSMSAQPDVKRKLVYSTAGQMGFMSLQCAVGAPGAAIFHLIAHGLFKCQMFLQSGSAVAEGLNSRKFAYGLQDGREGKGLRNSLIVVTSALAFVCFYTTCIDFDWTSLSAAITGAALLCAIPALDRVDLRSLCLFLLTTLLFGIATGFGRRFFEMLLPAEYAINEWLLPVFLLIALVLAFTLHLARRSSISRALYVHSLNGFYLGEVELSRK